MFGDCIPHATVWDLTLVFVNINRDSGSSQEKQIYMIFQEHLSFIKIEMKSTTIFALIFAVAYHSQDAAAHRHLRRVMKPDETQGFLSIKEEVITTKVSERDYLSQFLLFIIHITYESYHSIFFRNIKDSFLTKRHAIVAQLAQILHPVAIHHLIAIRTLLRVVAIARHQVVTRIRPRVVAIARHLIAIQTLPRVAIAMIATIHVMSTVILSVTVENGSHVKNEQTLRGLYLICWLPAGFVYQI